MGDGDTNSSWGAWNGLERNGKSVEQLEIRGLIETIRRVFSREQTCMPEH